MGRIKPKTELWEKEYEASKGKVDKSAKSKKGKKCPWKLLQREKTVKIEREETKDRTVRRREWSYRGKGERGEEGVRGGGLAEGELNKDAMSRQVYETR